MTATVLVIFLVVYVGMLLGRYPRLQLDRTGIALLGAIALLATGALRFDEAVGATGARSHAQRSEHGSGRMTDRTRANDRRTHQQRSEGPRTAPTREHR